MKLELRGITKRFGSSGRERPHRPHRRARRDPLPARRERRRQVHAHERALRPVPGRRGRDPARRRGPALRRARRRDGGRHRHGAPALHAHPRLHGRRERHARPRADQARRPASTSPARAREGPRDLASGSVSTSTPTRSSRTCRSACSSASRSSRRCRATRRCSSSTSRPRCSPRRRPTSSWRSCASSSEAGTSIVFITHKLREVREVADRITVIRLGKVVGEASARRASNAELASLMVGRAVELTVRQGRADARRATRSSSTDLTVLDPHRPARRQRRELHGPRRRDPRRRRRAGQRPDRAHRGARRPAAARHGLASTSTATSSSRRVVRKMLDAGVGFVPEDRTEDGLVAEFTIAENLMLDRSRQRPVREGAATCSSASSPTSPAQKVDGVRRPHAGHRRRRSARLSGGNQQKVVLARELSRDLRLLRRRAADPRRRRRLDRVRPQAHRRDARRRRPGDRRLDRARRGRRARRPHRGHVPRPHRRHRPRRHPPRRARPHDGRRGPAEGAAA